eukprot:NODE_237_length_11991_cov_1.642899.p10 type:complete len:176 gc:universal NODE_237_length_11991_cov_1.642899:4187-4714(+)
MLLAILLIFGTLKLYSREEAQRMLDAKFRKYNNILIQLGIENITPEIVLSTGVPKNVLLSKSKLLDLKVASELTRYVNSASKNQIDQLSRVLDGETILTSILAAKIQSRKIFLSVTETTARLEATENRATINTNSESRSFFGVLRRAVTTPTINLYGSTRTASPTAKTVQRRITL